MILSMSMRSPTGCQRCQIPSHNMLGQAMAAPARNRPLQPIRNVQQPLAREKAEVDALFLSIGEGAIVTDAQGDISRINKTALSLLGLTENEVLGRWFPDTIIAEDEAGNIIPNINRPITEVFLSGKPVFSKIYYRRKDQGKIAVALTVSPVLLDGKPIGAIEVFRDITQEVQLEKAKDEFISLVSHQLRTPATGVKQYAGMLLDGYAGELSNLQLSMVQTIYEINERQIATVNDLLRVAQIDAGQVRLIKQRTALTPLLEDIIDEQVSKFNARSQKAYFHYPDKDVWVNIDAARMRMAIENIIDNASKYTPPHKQILVSMHRKEKTVSILVQDEGVGIAKEDINQIFEKFSRLDSALSATVGGTGLGLYWARKIIDLHGASLDVKSKLNKGTTFIITLPVAV